MFINLFLERIILEAFADNKATNIHHKVLVVINKQPKNKNENTRSLLAGSTNCGKNARKNRATFGLRILVKTALSINSPETFSFWSNISIFLGVFINEHLNTKIH